MLGNVKSFSLASIIEISDTEIHVEYKINLYTLDIINKVFMIEIGLYVCV